MPIETDANAGDQNRRAIAHHYNLSNEFYALFLDPEMVYTCAWYRDTDIGLAQAQADKLELVCRKLDLQSGDRLLDIGCGWGSLARYAARTRGVEVLGVTLSDQQATFAQQRIREESLEKTCRVEFCDYRSLGTEKKFNKIAAIGIIEHIGRENYGAYFHQVHHLLEDGGLFLNHGITRLRHWKRTPQWDFLLAHVFPNGDLTHISHLTEEMESAHFEILDVENLREHYAKTCASWTRRLQAAEKRAIACVGPKTYRTWLVYLAASAVAFEEGSIFLHQTLARKSGETAISPRNRGRLYRNLPALTAGSVPKKSD
jgi:cyclopropane-fatty-acyl-phospholipid synthase